MFENDERRLKVNDTYSLMNAKPLFRHDDQSVGLLVSYICVTDFGHNLNFLSVDPRRQYYPLSLKKSPINHMGRADDRGVSPTLEGGPVS